ncbi:MAG: hypothetical protein M3O26_14085 [Pseudomonadota bacterium]|nr:hypothetical protein [Pseudomonadota bacterium]
MKKTKRLILALGVLSLFGLNLGFANAESDAEPLQLATALKDANASGITGTATVTIGEEGLRGTLRADHLKVGHAYTVWFFYGDSSNMAGPGRFSSTVAQEDGFTFHGSVGGLHVSSGAVIKLVIFYHPDLTAVPTSMPVACAHMPPSDVARANNLLTPACAMPVAEAVFNIS